MKRICIGVAAMFLATVTVACAAPPAAEADRDSADVVHIGSMSVARAAHQATRLPSGKVLVTGGCAGQCDQTLDTVELFDPANRRFEILAPLAVARNSHAAVALADGRALVLGGWRDAQVTASAEIFNPAVGGFERAADMTVPRAVPIVAMLADGRVLVTGGQTAGMAPLGSAEIFDPASGQFTATAPMGSPRLAHVAVTLADGRVLVAGGVPARRGEVLRSA